MFSNLAEEQGKGPINYTDVIPLWKFETAPLKRHEVAYEPTAFIRGNNKHLLNMRPVTVF